MATNSLQATDRPQRFRQIAVNTLGIIVALGVAMLLANALLSGRENTAIAITGLGLVLMTIILDSRLGLLLWLVLAPLDRYLTLSLGHGIPDLGLSRLAAMLLLFLLIAQFTIGRRRLARVTLLEVAAALFAIAMLASVPSSWMSLISGTQTVFDFVIIPLLVYLLARNLLTEPQTVRWLAIAVAATVVPLAIIAGREQLTGQAILSPVPYTQEYGRFTHKVLSVFGAPAIMALTFSVSVPILLYATVREKGLTGKFLWGGALVTTLLGSFLVYVRGGWLGAVAGAGVMLALSRRARRYLPHFMLIALVLVIVLYGSVINPKAVAERFGSEQPIDYRLTGAQLSWQIFKRSPFFGVGFDNFGRTVERAGWQPHRMVYVLPTPHNTYLYVLTSAGLAGLLPFLAILAGIIWQAIRLWSRPGVDHDLLAMLLGMVAGYMLTIGTFDTLNARFANMLFYIIVGTVLGTQERALQAVTV